MTLPAGASATIQSTAIQTVGSGSQSANDNLSGSGPDDGDNDDDSDDIPNTEEYERGTLAQIADSGLDDGDEVAGVNGWVTDPPRLIFGDGFESP